MSLNSKENDINIMSNLAAKLTVLTVMVKYVMYK